MAFDSGLLRCVIQQLNQTLAHSRVEKVLQPEKDEIVLLLRCESETLRLSLSASAHNPRLHLTKTIKENPIKAPMFCMLLRKHLSGARFASLSQRGFERVFELTFDTRDEMGFPCRRKLIGEIMGKYSNIIFCDENDRILAPLKTIDFTTSSKRQVLPGMLYEDPPPQTDKTDPFSLDEEGLTALFASCPPDLPASKAITGRILGVSSPVARELVYRITSDTSSTVSQAGEARLAKAVGEMKAILDQGGVPSLLRDERGQNVEYAFLPLTQYGAGYTSLRCESFSSLIDTFFSERDNAERIKQRSGDIHRTVSNNIARLVKKLALIEGELIESAKKEEQKKCGDLITAYIYLLKRGQESARLTDFESGEEVEIALDSRLTPAQNAQRYYKKYAKAKKAESELTKQKELAETELAYMRSVLDALERADDLRSLEELRRELQKTGYLRAAAKTASRKEPPSEPLRFVSPNGLTVLCGKNNTQNDLIAFKYAGKNDWWFHVKNAPGSHVVLLSEGEEPADEDINFALSIAASHSSIADSDRIEVDYTRAKNLKKPAGALPGFVVYYTNYSAIVTPKLMKKNGAEAT